MNSKDILQAANPIDDTAFADSWTDTEGRASFERIVADDRTENGAAHRPPRRRRRLAIGVAVAAAAGTAVAVVGLPGSPNHGGTSGAWAVTKHPDGSITVTIQDNRDPAGLQAALRKAGLRANVTTASDNCVSQILGRPRAEQEITFAFYVGDRSTFHAPYTWERLFAGSPYDVIAGHGYGTVVGVDGQGPTPQRLLREFAFTVHPHALPPGDVVNIGLARDRTLLVDVEKAGAPLRCGPSGHPDPI